MNDYPFAEDFVFYFGPDGDVGRRRFGRFCQQFVRLGRRLADGFGHLLKHLQQFRGARRVQLTRHLALHQGGEVLVNGRVIDAAALARLRMRLELGDPFEEKRHCVVHPQHVHFVLHQTDPLFDGCLIRLLLVPLPLLTPVVDKQNRNRLINNRLCWQKKEMNEYLILSMVASCCLAAALALDDDVVAAALPPSPAVAVSVGSFQRLNLLKKRRIVPSPN